MSQWHKVIAHDLYAFSESYWIEKERWREVYDDGQNDWVQSSLTRAFVVFWQLVYWEAESAFWKIYMPHFKKRIFDSKKMVYKMMSQYTSGF